MAKGIGNAPDRRLRRNRWIGAALFIALAVGCWAYYEYCMRADLSVTQHTQAKGAPASGNKGEAEAAPFEGKAASSRRKERRENETGYTASAADAIVGGYATETTPSELELPFFTPEAHVIHHSQGRYTLLYDTLHRQAAWVAYLLTGQDAKGKEAKRSDRFLPDPVIAERKLPSASAAAYRNSGYDRGHLCPSADRTCSQTENDCTFYLSNISPQTPALNRGPWKQLEEQVRKWAIRYDSLYVVAGGVLAGYMETLPGGIGIPNYFYKAVLTRSQGEFNAVGFVFPNAARFEGGYRSYAVTVDSLETLTSIDFFHSLPDSVESSVESVYSPGFWFE